VFSWLKTIFSHSDARSPLVNVFKGALLLQLHLWVRASRVSQRVAMTRKVES